VRAGTGFLSVPDSVYMDNARHVAKIADIKDIHKKYIKLNSA
jgi:hypothetical protein